MNTDQSSPVRLLLVDDDKAFRNLVRRYLRRTHFNAEIVEAEDATTALEHTKQDEFSLIFSDFRLESNDGLWLLEEIRSHEKATSATSVPFIMLTAIADQSILCDIKEAGVTELISKEEINPTSLRKILNQHLSKIS